MTDRQPRHTRYVVVLALAAAVILVGGWLARPRGLPQQPAPVPSVTELAQLARRAERRALETRADYFADIAADIAPSLVRIEANSSTAVVWDPQRLITTPVSDEHSPFAVTVSDASDSMELQLTLRARHLPFAAFEPPAALTTIRTPVKRAASMPQPGAPILVVWCPDDDHTFVTGTYGQLARAVCGSVHVDEIVSSISMSAPMAGGGLFDIDGALLGIVLPCNQRVAAVAVASVDALLKRADTLEQQLLARYGLSLMAGVTNGQSSGDDVLVSQIWTGSPADQAGLQAGDRITAIDGVAVTAVNDFRTMLDTSTTPVWLTIQRGARTVQVELQHDADRPTRGADVFGVVWRLEQGVHRVEAILPGSRADQSDLEPGDRLVRIDHIEAARVSEVQRLLLRPAATPTLLEIERGERRLAILLR